MTDTPSPASPEFPGPCMPLFCYLALHSQATDNLFTAPERFWRLALDLLGGFLFVDFMRGVNSGLLSLQVTLEATGTGEPIPWVWVWIHFPNQPRIAVAAVDHAVIGADPDMLLREQSMRMDDALATILDGRP